MKVSTRGLLNMFAGFGMAEAAKQLLGIPPMSRGLLAGTLALILVGWLYLYRIDRRIERAHRGKT